MQSDENKKSEEDILERGREQGRKEVACRMLAEGIEVALVVKLSGLSEKVVRSLTCLG